MLLDASAYIASLSIQQCMCLLVHLGLVQLIRKPVSSYSSVMVSKFKTVAKKKIDFRSAYDYVVSVKN